MVTKFPPIVRQIFETLSNAGYEGYVVGGAVRNLLMEKEVKDYDFTTNATPEQILAIFPQGFYDNTFGTVGVPHEGKVYEITTYRTEIGFSNARHPDKVAWGKTLEEDLERRDFTINSLAVNKEGNIIDLHSGKEDLKNKIIRAVGNPDERFKEDALRLMRAIRIATEHEFTIEPKTFQAIKEDAQLIERISKERIHDELLRILKSEHPQKGFELLFETGILQYIIPELTVGAGITQARHHIYDVWTHNLRSLKTTPSKDPIVRFATLLHDVGKPTVRKEIDGIATFYNHEVVGQNLTRQIMQRLHFSNKEIDKAALLVRWHMFTVDEHITDAAVRRFIRRVGVENVKDMIDLRIGDRLGGGCKEATSWRLRKFMERIIEVQKTPLSVKDLKINGTDVMNLLNIPPSPKVGQILSVLFEEVMEDASKNTKEYLENRAKELA